MSLSVNVVIIQAGTDLVKWKIYKLNHYKNKRTDTFRKSI